MPDFNQDIIRTVRIQTEVNQEKISKAASTLDKFYHKYENKAMKVDVSDFAQAADSVRALREELESTKKNSPHMEGIINKMSSDLDAATKQFETTMVRFTDGTSVKGIGDAVTRISEGAQVSIVDLGDRMQGAKAEIESLWESLKKIGKPSQYNDKWYLNGSFTQNDLSQRIELVGQLLEAQQDLQALSGKKMEGKEFASGYSVSGLNSSLATYQKQLDQMRKFEIETTNLLAERENTLSTINNFNWSDNEQISTKENINNAEEYVNAINKLKYNINNLSEAMSTLQNSPELFKGVNIDESLTSASENINKYKAYLDDLQNFKAKGGPGADLTPVIDSLNQIKDALQVISNAFQNENDAMRTMAENGVTSFTSLSEAIISVYNNLNAVNGLVDEISKKEFNVTNITQTGQGDSGLQTMQRQMLAARETQEHLRKLYDDASNTLILLNQNGRRDLVGEYIKQLQELDMFAINKSIKGANSEMKLASVLTEMQDYISKLTQINELRNKYNLGNWKDSFVSTQQPTVQVDAIKSTTDAMQQQAEVQKQLNAEQKQQAVIVDTSSEVQQMANLKGSVDEVSKAIGRKNAGFIKEQEIVASTVEAEKQKIGELVEAINNVLANIKTQFAQAFVIPGLSAEQLQTSFDGIYNKFVELRDKVGQLEFNITPKIVEEQKTPAQTVFDISRNQIPVAKGFSRLIHATNENAAQSISKTGLNFEKYLSLDSTATTDNNDFLHAGNEFATVLDIPEKYIRTYMQAILTNVNQAFIRGYINAITGEFISNPEFNPDYDIMGELQAKAKELLEQEASRSKFKRPGAALSGQNSSDVQREIDRINALPQSTAESASTSQIAVSAESQSAENAAKQFIDAAKAKKEFVEANKQVAQSAKKSAEAVKEEGRVAEETKEKISSSRTDIDAISSDAIRPDPSTAGKITTTQPDFGEDPIKQVKEFSSITDNSMRKIIESYTAALDEDGNFTGKLQLNTVKIIDDIQKRTDAIADENKKIAQKKADIEKFLSQSESKTSGLSSLLQDENGKSYADQIKNVIGKDSVNLDDIDTAFTLMSQMETEYNKVVQSFRKGASSLNPFVNAINSMDKLDNVIKNIELSFSSLSKQPEDVKKQVDKLSPAFQALQKQYNVLLDDPEHANIYEFAKAFGELRLQINGTKDAILLARKQQGLDTKGTFLELDKQANTQMLANMEKQWQQQGLLTDEVRKKIKQLGNDLTSITNRDDLGAWTKKWGILKKEVAGTKIDKANFTSQDAKVVQARDSGYLGDTDYQKWEQQLAAYRQYLSNAEGVTEEKTAAMRQDLIQLFDQTMKTAQASKNFAAKGGILEGVTLQPGQSMKDLYNQVIQLNQFDGLKTAITNVNDEMDRLTFTVDNGSGALTTYQLNVNKTTGAVQLLGQRTKQALIPMQQLFASLKKDFTGLTHALVGGTGIYKFAQIIRTGVQAVKDLDLAMTELKKVTDETEATYDKFLGTASEMAGRVGSTMKDIVSSTADWSRLGYAMSDAIQMAESTQILMNVSEFTDVSKATDTLISAVQAKGCLYVQKCA